jgi:hypothetical protein
VTERLVSKCRWRTGSDCQFISSAKRTPGLKHRGLPLALELAAARLKVLSPEALPRRLERRLPLFTGDARDVPERQQTLRATIAWSDDLLTPAEQVLFRQSAVFLGAAPRRSSKLYVRRRIQRG